MMDPHEMFARLAEPFDVERVSWRVGSTNAKSRKDGDPLKGMALAYIDARDVMDRLDLVCGPGGWQNRYPHANGKTVCEIGILVPRERRIPGAGPGGCTLVEDDGPSWVWKADGAGDTDYEAEKGALSDAFKRAAVRWGIGRYLYELPSPWVAVDQRGQTFVIKDSEYGKLRQLLRTHTGISAKSAAQAKKDQDFEFFKEKIEAAQDLEALGAIGREIKNALPMLPAAHREPLQDAYLARREELQGLAA